MMGIIPDKAKAKKLTLLLFSKKWFGFKSNDSGRKNCTKLIIAPVKLVYYRDKNKKRESMFVNPVYQNI
jgi:hypothetical protein